MTKAFYLFLQTTSTAAINGAASQSSKSFTLEGAMKTKEFFQNLPSLAADGVDPEFHIYTAVWIKTRMPEAYNELRSSFKHIENEIYAQYACDDAHSEQPF